MGRPSRFLREQIRKAAEAGRAGDSAATRAHLEHAYAEDPDFMRHVGDELKRPPTG